MTLWLAVVCFLCAAIPAGMFATNLRLYREPPAALGVLPAVSILIPARNEAAGIASALQAASASRNVDFEILVMDDGSTDGTDTIVLERAANDPRIRLERAPALPAGWNGKQHACWALARAAHHPILCFVDADVRLGPECITRMVGFLQAGRNSLVSGFPRQITGSFLEWLLLPLIHFVLLGFLPLARMRTGTDPAFAAGCGQFMMADRDAYFACGGHNGIKLTMHDGLRLPRLFREAGLRTDLADLTDLATCRMYTTAGQVWSGLAKNATEGIAEPARIVPISLILLLGQVLPTALSVFALITFGLLIAFGGMFGIDVHWTGARPGSAWLLLPIALVICAYLPRILAAQRFRQDWRSALLHPLGIIVLLLIQWYALIRKLLGSPVSWRNRSYSEPDH